MLLKDSYRKGVYESENFISGWSTNHYGIFSHIIEENQYKHVAEVGIGYGMHAKYVMKTTNVEKMYLVDPMRYYENDGFSHDVMSHQAEIPGNNFNELYSLIQEELSPWKDKLVFLRVPSVEVTQDMIPDESLDCVFIDGDHSFSAVLADLQFWWKKIRKGGQMLGDDIFIDSVRDAVNMFPSISGVPYDLLEKENAIPKGYKIYRFKKD